MKSFIFILVNLMVLQPVMAQSLPAPKIGFVSTDKVFREVNSAKLAQAKLEQEFQKREKELVDLEVKIREQVEKLERDAPTLSESQKATRQKQINEIDRDMQRKRREFQEDLNARRNEEFQQILDKANKVIKQIAEAEKFDLILQEAVYINPNYDITEKVIKTINSNK